MKRFEIRYDCLKDITEENPVVCICYHDSAEEAVLSIINDKQFQVEFVEHMGRQPTTADVSATEIANPYAGHPVPKGVLGK